ncbi:hypothetical protein SAMN05216352_113132 [Alteribacillus bidgolensis]|uniref:Uncharacterized protein n=1 Tax=Alteribacillus bidgolensis TaxID=930129 RepID=A0A1G8P5S2_9BACI|nr:hypothetical protein SAMN05216352_113132 [Alteribacillus bidgolensis]
MNKQIQWQKKVIREEFVVRDTKESNKTVKKTAK